MLMYGKEAGNRKQKTDRQQKQVRPTKFFQKSIFFFLYAMIHLFCLFSMLESIPVSIYPVRLLIHHNL